MKASIKKTKQYQNLIQTLKKISPNFIGSNHPNSQQKDLGELWHAGGEIYKTQQSYQHGQKEALMTALAEDAKISRTDLFQLTRFHRCFPNGFPKLSQANNLSWTHVRSVLSLPEKKQRLYYLRYAAKEGLSTRNLERAIKANLYLSESNSDTDHPHGFLDPQPNAIYTYKTKVLKVKDGDTLVLSSDKGFYSRQEYTGRLRGINCSELNGPNAKLALKAKAHVEQVLTPCEFVLATTYKPDSFGRTVVDIRYHPVWQDINKIYAKGIFLNQELLDLGLARLASF